MPTYLVTDSTGLISAAYSGPASGAPTGAVSVPASIYAQLPRNIAGWSYVNGALVAPVAPAPTLAQQAAAAIAAGLTVTSASTPAINGVYACNDAAQAQFNRVYSLIQRAGGNAFPGGLSELPWVLANGTVVNFSSVSTFLSVEQAVGDYVFALDLIIATGKGTLPPSSVSLP